MKNSTIFKTVVEQNFGRLKGLIGQSFEAIHVVWYEPWNMIHASSPVVFSVKGENLELWSTGFSEFSLSWNTIDLEKAPFYWIENPDPDSYWSTSLEETLTKATGEQIINISLVPSEGLCAGIQFHFQNWSLTIITYCDELIITDSYQQLPESQSIN